MNERTQKFSARQDGVVVEDLGGELLVYDRSTDVAHCLNEVAAVAWRSFEDGATVDYTAGQILAAGLASSLEDARALAAAAAVELGEKGLLEQEETPGFISQRVPRRQALRRLAGVGMAAAAGPLVVSAAIPSAALATACTGVLPTKIWYAKTYNGGGPYWFELNGGYTNSTKCAKNTSDCVNTNCSQPPADTPSLSNCHNSSFPGSSFAGGCGDLSVTLNGNSVEVSSTFTTNGGEIPDQSQSFMLCPNNKYYHPTSASGGFNGLGKLIYECPSNSLVSCAAQFGDVACT